MKLKTIIEHSGVIFGVLTFYNDGCIDMSPQSATFKSDFVGDVHIDSEDVETLYQFYCKVFPSTVLTLDIVELLSKYFGLEYTANKKPFYSNNRGPYFVTTMTLTNPLFDNSDIMVLKKHGNFDDHELPTYHDFKYFLCTGDV